MSTLVSALRRSASGLAAERFRMDVISANIANANSMRVGNEEPYRRRDVLLRAGENGVEIAGVQKDYSPYRYVNDPNHPFADASGKVEYSNVEPVMEMVNMLGASRSYEANIAAFNTAKTMVRNALNIGRI